MIILLQTTGLEAEYENRQYNWTCLGLIIPFYWITEISGAESLPCYSNYCRPYCLRKMRPLYYNGPSFLSKVNPKPWSLDTGLLTWFGPSSHSKVVPDRWMIRVLQGWHLIWGEATEADGEEGHEAEVEGIKEGPGLDSGNKHSAAGDIAGG